MKSLLIVVITCLSTVTFGQFSVGGGLTNIFQFGNNKPFSGFHVVGELPQNDEVSFYGRIGYTFPQKSLVNNQVSALAIDLTTVPYAINVEQFEKFNFFTIDGGSRYYFINGFDEGFSLYGGTNLGISVNTVRFSYSDFDQTLYKIDSLTYPSPEEKGTIIGIMAGLSGGAKYTMPGRGSIYLDINPSLMLYALPSNNIAAATNRYRPLVFNIGIGYRKELY